MLILCTSLTQVRKVLKIIKQWSSENNLKFNPKKSGILKFIPRLGNNRAYLVVGEEIEGIPIVSKYKCLGLWIDSKLTIDPQMDHIEKKGRFIQSKLWGVLKHFSLDYRINLWNTLIRPLFEMLIFLYDKEGQTNRGRVETLIRKTFKKLTFLSNNIPTETINELMKYNFSDKVERITTIANIKWETRKLNKIPSIDGTGIKNEKLTRNIFQKNSRYFLT